MTSSPKNGTDAFVQEARDAGLRYTSDDQPGIIRLHQKSLFVYHRAPTGYLTAGFLWAFLAFWQRRYGP